MTRRVEYDTMAADYDARYRPGVYDGVLAAIRMLVCAQHPASILEVGCGTGHWLRALRDLVPHRYGLDYSREMLRQASKRESGATLVRGTADRLPFRAGTLDFIFCINAIHHFAKVDCFIAEVRRLLRPAGLLAVIGMDPHHGRDHWCVYDYFPETRTTDLTRYPSSGQITDAMLRAGFERVECGTACRIKQASIGQAIFDNPELQRRGCSQMALLSDDQYMAGIERLRAALRQAGPGESPPAFKAEIDMMMLCGYVAP